MPQPTWILIKGRTFKIISSRRDIRTGIVWFTISDKGIDWEVNEHYGDVY